MIFTRLSIKYWKSHKKRMITLATVTGIGAVALCLVALFIRSEKAFLLNRELDMLGDYDAVFYELDEKDMDLITEHEGVSFSGFYRELGYAGANDSSDCKVISFPDDHSTDIYHMSCTKGNYPQKENEIAMDINTAKKFGVSPEPGQKVRLTLYDMEKHKLGTEDYILSGVFEASAEDVFGGFYRYPTSIAEYDVPVICVSDTKAEVFKNSLVTAFIQTDGDVWSLISEISELDFSQLEGIDVPAGRTTAYSYVLGILDHITDTYGELTVDNLTLAIEEGNVWKDFYSSIVIPLFGVLIFIIVAGSVFSLVRSLLVDRSEEVAILRSIGMTKGQVFCYLFVELLVLISVFIGIGLLFGCGIYYLVIKGMNAIYYVNIPLCLHTNKYVTSVTISPWIYTISVLEISSMLAIIFPLFKMVRTTPIAIFEKRFIGKKGRRKHHFSDFSKCSWRKVIGEHIHFQDGFVLMVTAVVMSACFLGYNYFRALSELNNIEYAYVLQERGLEEWDYTASRTDMADLYEFLVENHHEYGVDQETYQEFANQDYIDQSFARIVNRSTRLSYEKQEMDDLSLPKYLSVRMFSESSDSFKNALYEAEDARIGQVGYSSQEDIYALPSIGVTEEEIAPLSSHVSEGTIDVEKIRKGEEVVLVIPSRMEKSVADCFHAGDSLPLSDVVLTQEEELYSFGQMIPSDYKEPSYKKTIKEPESGQKVELTSYAFGKRQNIKTKIGAIVVLDDEKLLERYTVPYETILSREIPDMGEDEDDEEDDEESVFYTMSIVCFTDTFSSWQLPDKLFTEVNYSLCEKADASKVNESWYQIFGKCKGISFQSAYEIKEKMRADEAKTMLICYLMVFMLIIMGIVAIGIKLYSKIKLQSQTIAKLRALGLQLSWLERMIVAQNAIYPCIGAIISVIPVSLCQMFFLYVKDHIDSGAWNGLMQAGEIPWWHYIPFRYNLFGYHPVLTLILLIGAFMVLILLATLPQIFFIRKQSIADAIDQDSF